MIPTTLRSRYLTSRRNPTLREPGEVFSGTVGRFAEERVR